MTILFKKPQQRQNWSSLYALLLASCGLLLNGRYAEAQSPGAQAAEESTVKQAPNPDRLQLTEVDAVARALQQSPNVETATLGVRNAGEQVKAEEGRYPYTLTADLGLTRTTSPQLRVDDSVATSSIDTTDASIGVRRVFPVGATAELKATEQYFDRDIQATTLNPYTPAGTGHGTTLRASVSQPLLRGFGKRIGEVELRAARVGESVAERALQKARSALARDVGVAYYELWYADRALGIEKASQRLAAEQEQQAAERVRLGALAITELLTFQTRSAELSESVVLAELTREQRLLSLSQLMGDVTLDVQWQAISEPEPLESAPTVADIRKALAADSVELAELQERVKQAQVRLQAAGDASRPRLDAEAYAQSSGTSQDLTEAWRRAAGLQWWSAHVGLSLELPFNQQRQDATVAQARLAVLSARSELRAAQARVASDAANAVAGERAARTRLASAERTEAIAQRAYAAAVARFEVGQTIPITLQQAQEDVRRAQLRVVRARVDATQHALRLQHLSGALAERYSSR